MKKILFLLLSISVFGQFGYQNSGGGTTVIDRPTEVTPMTSLYSLGFQSYNAGSKVWQSIGYGFVPDTDLLSFYYPSDSTDKPFTYAAWYYIEDSVRGMAVSKGIADSETVTSTSIKNAAEYEFMIHQNNKTFIAYRHDNDSAAIYQYNQTAPFSFERFLNKWVFVVAVAAGGAGSDTSWKIYFNGERQRFAQMSLGNNYRRQFNDTAGLWVGVHRKYDTLTYSSGCIDNIGFWKCALSDTEIVALYNGGKGIDYRTTTTTYSKADSLVAFWDFEEGTGTTATDKINNLVMTLAGVTYWVARSPVYQGNSESMFFDGQIGASGSSYAKFLTFNSGQYPTIADNLPWSISWYEYLFYKQYQAILGDVYSTNNYAELWWEIATDSSSRTFTFASNPSHGYVQWTGVTAAALRQWNKIVLTCDGTDTVELFINNVSQGKKYLSSTAIKFTLLGKAQGSFSYAPKGYLDEIKIYNEEIGSAERAANTIPRTTFPSNIVFYLDMNKYEYNSQGLMAKDIQYYYPFFHRTSMYLYKGTAPTDYLHDPVSSKNVPFKY